MINQKDIIQFKQKGFIHLKNFFSDYEIKKISLKCSEIVEKDNIIYRFTLKDLQQLKVKNFIKQKLINYFENKELKIKNFHQLNEILILILPDIKKKKDCLLQKLFIRVYAKYMIKKVLIFCLISIYQK